MFGCIFLSAQHVEWFQAMPCRLFNAALPSSVVARKHFPLVLHSPTYAHIHTYIHARMRTCTHAHMHRTHFTHLRLTSILILSTSPQISHTLLSCLRFPGLHTHPHAQTAKHEIEFFDHVQSNVLILAFSRTRADTSHACKRHGGILSLCSHS